MHYLCRFYCKLGNTVIMSTQQSISFEFFGFSTLNATFTISFWRLYLTYLANFYRQSSATRGTRAPGESSQLLWTFLTNFYAPRSDLWRMILSFFFNSHVFLDCKEARKSWVSACKYCDLNFWSFIQNNHELCNLLRKVLFVVICEMNWSTRCWDWRRSLSRGNRS